MSSLSNFNYPPPKNWQDFETLCRDLWREIWKDPNTRKNGRSGQEQQGVDVYGQPNRGKDWAGVQCKGKDNTYELKTVTETELLQEVEKARNFEPALSEWTLATTGPRDAKIEKTVRKINSEHQKKQLFTVHIWFWEDIVEELVKHQVLIGLHLPQINQNVSVEIITKLQSSDISLQKLTDQSNTQSTILESNANVLNEIASKIEGIQQIRHQDILTPHFNAEIDVIRDEINAFYHEGAIKSLEKLKSRIWSDASDPVKFRILSNLGSAFYGLGKFDEAGSYFREAFPFNPDNEIALTNLALAYSFQSDDEKTKYYAQKALEINPNNSNAYIILLQTDPCKDSVKSCLEIVPENLRNVGGIAFCIGLAALNENNIAESINWFEKSVASDDKNPVFKGYLAAMLMQSLWGDKTALLYGQATQNEKDVLNRVIELFTAALLAVEDTDLTKPNINWLLNRGIAKKLLGETDEAYQDIKNAYDVNPDDPQFIKHLALITLRTNEHPAAGDLLEKIKADPEMPEISIFLADFYNSNQKPDKALEVINDFLKWNQDKKLDFLAQRILVDTYLRVKDFDKARQEVERLLENYPHEPSTFFEATKFSFESKAESKAKDYIIQAKNLLTENTSVLDITEIGDALFGLKLYKDAAECYEKIADTEQDSIFTFKLVNAYYLRWHFKPSFIYLPRNARKTWINRKIRED